MAVPFLSGAIEGFYGQQWTHAERVALFDRLAAWGLNTYLYAPKDDLKHRALWREPYTVEESAALQRLIDACHARGLHFIFGLSPGLDIRYGAEADRDGPEIISREISLAHARELGAMLRRKPIIWDNLHANDYDGRRFFCGPYSGRPLELRNEVNGLLSNPNNELPLNFVPLRTRAAFVGCHGTWDARSAYLSAMEEWLLHFAMIGGPAVSSDLILFGDCYYLPHEEGPKGVELYHAARSVLSGDPAETNNVALFIEEAARRVSPER